MTPIAAVLFAEDRLFAGPLAVAAAGELLVDKLPIAPPRTVPAALVVRALSGGFCARRCAGREGAGLATALGVLGALAGSFGGYAARKALTVGRGRPDLPVALLEDALAIGLSLAAARRTSGGGPVA